MSHRELIAELFVMKVMKTPVASPFVEIVLESDRLIRRSIDLIRKSQEASDMVQERINRSLALIERSRVDLTGGNYPSFPIPKLMKQAPAD